MLQQETFLFTLICIVVFVHDAKGREININGNFIKKSYFISNCMFYLYSISLYKAFKQLKEKKLIIKTRLAVDNSSSCNSKLNVKERQFKI